MTDHAQNLHDGVGGLLGAALLAASDGARAAREQAAWARAYAAAEDAVHALGQRLLQAQARERALLAELAAARAEAQAQRSRACRAEGQLLGLRRRSAA
ncbi:hypothetical protein [Methylobacterium sp. SD21]|uniref:hypothetical protein n=1 Tax=Methylobacterium litchii TaxID=3138810 RepID=UPI00313C37C8